MTRWFSVPAFALAALASLAVWWAAGRPVALPDGAGQTIPCVSYTPFRDGQTPFDESLVVPPSQIEEDFRLLGARTRCVRTYSVDQGLENVPAIAARHGMTVLLGAWIGREHSKNQAQLDTAVRLANEYPNTVRAIIVGNEVLLRRERTAQDLTAYLAWARARTPVPLTYADVWEFWTRNPALARSVDFVTIHILPYWEDEPTANAAAPAYVIETWRRARQAFADREVFVGETGWPSAGRMREGARPGRIEQARFFRELSRLAEKENGLRYNLIEAFDQPWKRASEGTVGGHWGLFDTGRTVKFSWHGPVAAEPDWRTRFVAGEALALVLFAVAFSRPARAAPSAGRWLALAFFIHAAGNLLVAHVGATVDASRTIVEWTIGAGGFVGGLIAAGFFVRALAHGFDAVAAPEPTSAVLAWLARPDRRGLNAPLALGLVRSFFLAAALVHTLELVFDGRYREFPVAGYLVPAMVFAALTWIVQDANGRPERKGDAHGTALALVLAAGAGAVAVIEGSANHQALAWTATALLLAAPWLKPARP